MIRSLISILSMLCYHSNKDNMISVLFSCVTMVAAIIAAYDLALYTIVTNNNFSVSY